MELNFSEINDETEMPTQNHNYWEQDPDEQKQKKKKVTFNDILSNMNLVVNKQGVLQFMGAQQTSDKYNSNSNSNNEQIDHSVKHSYIYNKYFKDYVHNAEPVQPKIPKTKEEYYQMLMEERIKRQQLQKHLEQVKPKKLLLTGNPGFVQNNIQVSKNNLFKLNFR